MKVQGYNHLTINVSNLSRSLEFYTRVLGLALIHKGNSDAYLEWGAAWICLIEQPDYTVSTRKTIGFDHFAFTIAQEYFEEAIQVLQANKVQIVRGPIRRGVGWSVNFLDPDGVQLELHTSNLQERMKVWV